MSRYPGFEGRAVTDMLLKQGRENKYHAKRVQVDGIWFDSKKEAARYVELGFMERAGQITDVHCHPVFAIPNPNTSDDRHVCNVELDFMYIDKKTREYVYEDVKGVDTPVSRLKRKLVESLYRITVTVIK